MVPAFASQPESPPRKPIPKPIPMKTSFAKNLRILTAGILAIPAIACAGTAAAGNETPVEKCKESCISGSIGIDVVSLYISHGVAYENQGAILQPFGTLSFQLQEGEGALNGVSLDLGWWNTFHSRHTDAGAVGGGTPSTRAWFEADFSLGLTFTFLKNFTFSPAYTFYLSPNDAFETAQTLNFKLSYDDSDLLGALALHPWVNVWWEVENKIGTGADEGFIYEFGIAPSRSFGDLTVSLPISAGLGSSDGYTSAAGEDETYGYFTAGLSLSYALKCIPECYGEWFLHAGYSYFNLGDGPRDYGTAAVGGKIRDSRRSEHVFSGGLTVEF